MLDVRRMRVLREVAVRGSFSAAAESLSFTQSAISQQIAALEREAGARLVDRSARGVRLTDAGRVLVRHADAILAHLADAEAELAAVAGVRGGRLRVGAFESAAATIVPLAVAAFTERHPEVELTLTLAQPEEALAALRAGELEVGLTVDGVGEDESGLELVHLLDDPFFLVVAAGHPLATKPHVRLADAARESWVAGRSDLECNRLVFQACRTAGFDPAVAFKTDDYAAAQGLVAAGVGVALIAELGLQTRRDDVVVRSLGAEAPQRRVRALAATADRRSPAATAMLAVLREVTARDRPALALAA